MDRDYSDVGFGSSGVMFARLNVDGTATVDWPVVRRLAAEVRARKAADPMARLGDGEAIAALLWAVMQPGVKP